MYDSFVYRITFRLWRWEVRCGRVLVHCGTAPTKEAAETAVMCEFIDL